MAIIRQVNQGSVQLLSGLVGLLQDVVHHGASVGFLAPLEQAEANRYWQGVLADLGRGLVLWVAEQDGIVVGAIQLALCGRANGMHRADVQKLFVHSLSRGIGISSQLLYALEAFAKQQRRSLLVLDTEAGSLAEKIYQHWNWQRVGEIPGYAASPDGKLISTCYYYKQVALEDD
ncbi:GNAT family N-acetyltransferase [Solimicrobium silvestre]|nr:GNAT family N-acetyltransferase [Solimicrobium silvestre]